jgi:hypothetical protein
MCSGMCVASASTDGLVLDERDRSGERVTDHDDRDVDRDGLTLAHDDEVNVLDDLTNVVLLNVLDENEFLLALDVEVDEDVLVTNEKSQFVRGSATCWVSPPWP